MAATAALRRLANRLLELLRGYAREQGWARDEYRIFLRVRKSGFIHVILAVRAPKGGGGTFMDWSPVAQYLERRLDPEDLNMIRVAVWSFDQLAEGGLYTVSSDYTEYK
jgi:hypothetical protein